MTVQRVEKHILKEHHPYYAMLCDFTHKSKNLYNHANYIVRTEFCKNNKWVRYGELDKMLKADLEYDDYKQMPTAQAAQQTLRILEKDWKSFFASMKEWGKNKKKFLGKPKLPKYKAKDGRHILVLTNQNVKLKGNTLVFPKTFEGFCLQPKFVQQENFGTFQQVRILPKYQHFVIELVYNIEIWDKQKEDNGRYISIDMGVGNFATIADNIGEKPIVINGKGLKSMNQYYNKQISYYRELAKRMNGKDYTKRMGKLTNKRNRKTDDFLHKASKYVIKYVLLQEVNTIIIGNNKEWKQKSKMDKKVNRSFVGIPHMKFIKMLKYKAEEAGVRVILTEEAYTSGTSFLDEEAPIKENYDKRRRVHRGLFVSNEGRKINADVNGAMQIMKKVFPEVFADGIKGVVLHPIRVNIM